MPRLLELAERFDWKLCVSCLTLAGLGLVAIYGIAVSQEQENLFLFYKQFAALIMGVLIIVGMTWLDYRQLKALSFPIYLFGLLLLVLVLVFGKTIHSTQGWFRIGSLSFQPVELAKITLTIYLAALMTRHAHGRLSWRVFGLTGVATLVYVGLIFLQPDFGSGMVLIGIWGLLCLFSKLPRRAWIILPTCALVIGLSAWAFVLKPYQRDRIFGFLNPTVDVRGANYNAIQARIAIGSGGWFGKGLGEGSQARLRFLPEAPTDFIFSVLGEEIGFTGILFILVLYALIFYRFRRIAEEAQDDYAGTLIIGLAAIVLIHVFVNAGMNLGIMPITGIPMPLLSAGASSLLAAFLIIGIAESVAARRPGSR